MGKKSEPDLFERSSSNTASQGDLLTSKSVRIVSCSSFFFHNYTEMKFSKTIMCLTLLVLVTCRALEEEGQTIGWGKLEAAESGMESETDLKLVDELEDQHLGLGFEEDGLREI